jgi:hypothetical protein
MEEESIEEGGVIGQLMIFTALVHKVSNGKMAYSRNMQSGKLPSICDDMRICH